MCSNYFAFPFCNLIFITIRIINMESFFDSFLWKRRNILMIIPSKGTSNGCATREVCVRIIAVLILPILILFFGLDKAGPNILATTCLLPVNVDFLQPCWHKPALEPCRPFPWPLPRSCSPREFQPVECTRQVPWFHRKKRKGVSCRSVDWLVGWWSKGAYALMKNMVDWAFSENTWLWPNPNLTPTQGIREPSGKGDTGVSLGKVRVHSRQIGAADLNKNTFWASRELSVSLKIRISVFNLNSRDHPVTHFPHQSVNLYRDYRRIHPVFVVWSMGLFIFPSLCFF